MKHVCKVISATILGSYALRLDSKEDENGEEDNYDYPNGGPSHLIRQPLHGQTIIKAPPADQFSTQMFQSSIAGEARDARQQYFASAESDPRFWPPQQYQMASAMQGYPYSMQPSPMGYPGIDNRRSEMGAYAPPSGVLTDMQPKDLYPQTERLAPTFPGTQYAPFANLGQSGVPPDTRGAVGADVDRSSAVAQSKRLSKADAADKALSRPAPQVSLIDKTSNDYSANYADYAAAKDVKHAANASKPTSTKPASPASLKQNAESSTAGTAKTAGKSNKSSTKIKARHCRQPENFEGWLEYCKWSEDLHIYGSSVFMMNFEKCTMGWAAGPDSEARSRKDALCREDGTGFCRPYDTDGKKCSVRNSLLASNASKGNASSNASTPPKGAAKSKAKPASLVEAAPKLPAKTGLSESALQNGAKNPSNAPDSTSVQEVRALPPGTPWPPTQLTELASQHLELQAQGPQRWPAAYNEQVGVVQQFRPVDSPQMPELALQEGMRVPMQQIPEAYPSQPSFGQDRYISRPMPQQLPAESPQLSQAYQQMGSQPLLSPGQGAGAKGLPVAGNRQLPRLLKESLMEPSDTLVKLSGSVCPKQEDLLDGKDCYLRHDDQCQYVLEECPDGSAKTFTTLQCHGRRWVSRAHTMICTAADQSKDPKHRKQVSLQQASGSASMRGNSRRCPEREPTGLDDCDRPLNCQYVRGKCADGADNFVTWKCIAQQWMSTAVGCD